MSALALTTGTKVDVISGYTGRPCDIATVIKETAHTVLVKRDGYQCETRLRKLSWGVARETGGLAPYLNDYIRLPLDNA